MDATGDDLGSVVGFVPDERSARVGYASDGLLLVGLVCAGAVIFGDSPWWARVLAALLFVACLFGRPSGSLGEGLTLRVSVALMAVALTIVAVVGSLTSSSGIGRAFVLGGIAVSAVGLGLGIVDRRRDQVGWACHAGGLHRTSEAGETVTRFAWSEIATLDYKCTVVTVPVAGGPMVTTEERFGFALHDGPRWSMVLHGTGVPREIHSMGRPSAVSEAILAGVGEAQIGPAEQAIASGDTVAFGPLSVSGQGRARRAAWSSGRTCRGCGSTTGRRGSSTTRTPNGWSGSSASSSRSVASWTAPAAHRTRAVGTSRTCRPSTNCAGSLCPRAAAGHRGDHRGRLADPEPAHPAAAAAAAGQTGVTAGSRGRGRGHRTRIG